MKLNYYFLIVLFFISCKNETKVNPVYWNFETDLQENNLFGKVKEIEVYTISKTEKPILNSKTEYSEFGNIKTSEIYDENGKPINSVINNYNQNNRTIQIQRESDNFKIFEKIKYDTLNKITYRFIKVNDTLNIEVISNYDDKDKIITEIEINKTDTIFRNYKYEYNKQGKIIFEKELEIEKGYRNEQFRKYEFDTLGNIIKFQLKNQFFNRVNEVTYSVDNKVTEIKQYFITQDEKKELDKVFNFDDFFNRETETKYETGKTVNKIKNKYKIDNNGNWYEKSSYVKDKRTEKVTRKIKYWE